MIDPQNEVASFATVAPEEFYGAYNGTEDNGTEDNVPTCDDVAEPVYDETTWEPMPWAARTADRPATPAPNTTTLAGATPGIGPINFPLREPWAPSASRLAPTRAAI